MIVIIRNAHRQFSAIRKPKSKVNRRRRSPLDYRANKLLCLISDELVIVVYSQYHTVKDYLQIVVYEADLGHLPTKK